MIEQIGHRVGRHLGRVFPLRAAMAKANNRYRKPKYSLPRRSGFQPRNGVVSRFYRGWKPLLRSAWLTLLDSSGLDPNYTLQATSDTDGSGFAAGSSGIV